MYHLGLDIGTASVGYAVLDENFCPVETGVRLFQEANGNEERRANRHMRRNIRRRQHRLESAKRFLIRTGVCKKDFNFQTDDARTPYDCRYDGLRQRLSLEELAIALYHLVKRRGANNYDASGEEDSRAILEKNQELLQKKYVCEIQKERLDSGEKIRGHENMFFTNEYVREAYALLKEQSKYYDFITDEWTAEYINILKRRREYHDGPGTNGRPNQYGAGAMSRYGWSNQQEWLNNMRGKCSYFPAEPRIIKSCPTAELFNVLNDLNKLTINGKHLTTDQKVALVENLWYKTKTAPTLEKVLSCAGYIDEDIDNCRGYRINTKGKPVFTEMYGYHYIKSAAKQANFNVDMSDFDLLDEIIMILSTYQTSEEVGNQLRVMNVVREKNLSEEFIEVLATAKYKRENKATHNLSKKAMLLIMEDMWNTNHDSAAAFSAKNIRPALYEEYIKNGTIDVAIIDDRPCSPVVKRSLREAINLFNNLVEQYETFASVTIEMPRDNNSEEEQKRIRKSQSMNADLNEKVKRTLDEYPCAAGQNGLFDKIKLYFMQDGKDIYTQRELNIRDICEHPDQYEIDHIIPLSISFDNSFANKVLTTRKNNQDKGQRTPYEWLSSERFAAMTAFAYNTAKLHEKDAPHYMNQQKLRNLLFKGNIHDWNTQKSFIARNLCDTRYATKEICGILHEYCRQNDMNTQILTVNGKTTAYLRYVFGITKDRDADNSHHAIDAVIIAASRHIFASLNSLRRYKDENNVGTNSTGETVSDNEIHDAFAYFRKIIVPEIENIKKDCKYSYREDKKPNRQLSKSTFYGTRKECDDKGKTVEHKIATLGDIYAERHPKLNVLNGIINGTVKTMMADVDPETFKKLQQAYNMYASEAGKGINPLWIYFQKHGYVTKYAKKDNGPPVKSIKYSCGTIHSDVLDISEKQGVKNPNKRAVQESLGVYCIDVYQKGNKQIMVPVRYVHFNDNNVNEPLYEKLLKDKKITEEYKLYKRLYVGTTFFRDGKEYVYTGYNCANQIYAHLVQHPNTKEHKIKITISENLPPIV